VTPKRYTIVVESRQTGIEHSLTISLRPLLVVLTLVFSAPVLFGLAVRWSARGEMQMLRNNARTLEIENRSFKQATAELAGQVTSLQTTLTDLAAQSTLDPQGARTLAKMPGVMRARAVGGGNDGAPIRSALSPAFALPEDTFGVLRDLLGRLESRLEVVRTDMGKRSELVAAAPSMMPVNGWLSAPFGPRADPFTGSAEFHTGIDLSTEKGTPVVATGNATVASAGYNGAYGNMLVLDHGYGMVSRYAHLSAFAVKMGQKVTKGQVVGYVGATGRATGAHLHYEILVNGQLINPLQVITDGRH
jgi:murein DD-endopeptidase MepM/ murein hydrolase activator NlpD